ncbi:MAG: glycosyltransferase family 39 protein [Eubacterium sp.]|nr:glycosyltransferase family 39 protein [Eubacterium sp.]
MKNVTKSSTALSKVFLLVGIAVRIVFFIINLFVGGYNYDEVMTSLNAFSLAEKMTDIAGERLPVYFDTWIIGGQSPFATYLSALGVKLFGLNDFGVRIFSLVFSIIALFALYGFAKEVFGETKYGIAFFGLGCVSPWAIFSGTIMLDCNFLGHVLMIALYFFSKALNTEKTKYYVFSMIFFALGFYCYIASVLFIPILLLLLYLVLIIKRKISFKNLAASVLTVFVVSLPFIAFGLVSVGVIKPFELFGFNFSTMPGYVRSDTVVYSGGSLAQIIKDVFVSGVFGFILIIFADLALVSLGTSVFQYANLFCGAFVLFGLVVLILELFKKSKKLNFNQKLFALAFFVSVMFFASSISDVNLGTVYRISIFSYFIIYIEAIGLAEAFSKLKKIDFKKVLSVYLALSLALFSLTYTFVYAAQMNPNIDDDKFSFNYGDAYYACLDFAEEQNGDRIVTYKSVSAQFPVPVYIRHYYYDKIDSFIPIDDEFIDALYRLNASDEDEIKRIETSLGQSKLTMNDDGSYSYTDDGKLAFKYYEKGDTLTDDICVVETRLLDNVKYDKQKYSVKTYCFWSVVYKTS